MIYLEIILAAILILSCLLDDYLQEHLSYRASDYLSKVVGILTILWLGLIFYRWIFLS